MKSTLTPTGHSESPPDSLARLRASRRHPTRRWLSYRPAERPPLDRMNALLASTPPVTAGSCPRCGERLFRRTRGRPPRWCSQRCRRAAYEERRAATNGAVAIKIVDRTVAEPEHDLSECVRRASGSPAASRRILQSMTARIRAGELRGDPPWEATIKSAVTLAEAMIDTAPRGPRYWR